jgi:hypothetical protein
MQPGSLDLSQPYGPSRPATGIALPLPYATWEPRRLTTLRAFTACYRDSFTFTLCNLLPIPVISFLFCPKVLLSTLFSCTHNLHSYLYIRARRDSSVDRPGLGRPRFDFRHGQDIFLYSTASRPALRPIQFPFHLVLRSRIVELYLHSLIRL